MNNIVLNNDINLGGPIAHPITSGQSTVHLESATIPLDIHVIFYDVNASILSDVYYDQITSYDVNIPNGTDSVLVEMKKQNPILGWQFISTPNGFGMVVGTPGLQQGQSTVLLGTYDVIANVNGASSDGSGGSQFLFVYDPTNPPSGIGAGIGQNIQVTATFANSISVLSISYGYIVYKNYTLQNLPASISTFNAGLWADNPLKTILKQLIATGNSDGTFSICVNSNKNVGLYRLTRGEQVLANQLIARGWNLNINALPVQNNSNNNPPSNNPNPTIVVTNQTIYPVDITFGSNDNSFVQNTGANANSVYQVSFPTGADYLQFVTTVEGWHKIVLGGTLIQDWYYYSINHNLGAQEILGYLQYALTNISPGELDYQYFYSSTQPTQDQYGGGTTSTTTSSTSTTSTTTTTSA